MDTLLMRTTCAQNSLMLSDAQLRLLQEYATGLLEWNQKINLVSRRDEENLWTRHILHCLSLLFKLEIAEGTKILDLGTGGGLPGVVLKIARPDLQLTLIDSTQKKINVVKNLISSLDLEGIDALWGRAEEVGKQNEHAGRYDVVVARAVAPLTDLARWSHPLLKKDAGSTSLGHEESARFTKKPVNGPALVAFKGGDLDGEVKQLRGIPGVGQISVIELTLLGSTQLDDRDKKIVVVDFARSNK